MSHSQVASSPPAESRAAQRPPSPGQFRRELAKANATSPLPARPRVRTPVSAPGTSRRSTPTPARTPRPPPPTSEGALERVGDAPAVAAPATEPLAAVRLAPEPANEVFQSPTMERFASLTSAAAAMVERIERFLTARLEPALNLTFREGPIRSARIERLGRNGVRIEVTAAARSQRVAVELALRAETTRRGLSVGGLTVR